MNERLLKMAAQIERLSFMVEYLSDTGFFLDDAEAAWHDELLERTCP